MRSGALGGIGGRVADSMSSPTRPAWMISETSRARCRVDVNGMVVEALAIMTMHYRQVDRGATSNLPGDFTRNGSWLSRGILHAQLPAVLQHRQDARVGDVLDVRQPRSAAISPHGLYLRSMGV